LVSLTEFHKVALPSFKFKRLLMALTLTDDWYEGMLIPKGATVWLGIWSMHQNPDLFPEPERFNPDRFVNHKGLANEYAVSADYKNRDHYGYGAGRRLCPGIHLAERSMWRTAAKLLWAFDFAELPDHPLDVNAYTSANLVGPLEYKISVKVRSPEHLALVKKELAGALDFLSQYE